MFRVRVLGLPFSICSYLHERKNEIDLLLSRFKFQGMTVHKAGVSALGV
jgi:hypothetical protein